jgi:hypothetical protein
MFLIDRHTAFVEHLHLGFIVVDADNFVADFSETDRSD